MEQEKFKKFANDQAAESIKAMKEEEKRIGHALSNPTEFIHEWAFKNSEKFKKDWKKRHFSR